MEGGFRLWNIGGKGSEGRIEKDFSRKVLGMSFGRVKINSVDGLRWQI